MAEEKESAYTHAPPPPTALARYRNLSKLAGVLVSPICLGAMSIGDKWHKIGFAYMDKEQSFKLLDAFYTAGGNFIDTANSYQDESSEEFIGEWMESRKIRDHIVIATKYSLNYKGADKSILPHARLNYLGNSAKSMRTSVRDSLRKLRTDYIDILYVHWWGYDTSIPEIMGHLHDLVASGKVLYLGVSDTPAWVVSQANMWATLHGKTPFSVYQGAWNVMDRSFERDIIPMAREWGMALAPWNVLAGGKLRTDAEEERRRQTGEKGRDTQGAGWERTPDERKMSLALEKVAKEVGTTSITAVAIAYLMQKTPYVFPIVGGRKVEHLMDNIKALEIRLTPDQIASIESVVPFDLGFPHNFVGDGTHPNIFYQITGQVDFAPRAQPIQPSS
ncbi:arylalcohol dehydrogenase [Exidia glandulosa HHB12029]|uniref:Arylalcohol dehydrogenase n=1 Tax=Exidia glandulosa HHB12029 TaxID=1314781 RepID=A0A165FF04_EXIGL|nr:arylalcohol dehydrogenase [Exidia glandulosa HHB12029]